MTVWSASSLLNGNGFAVETAFKFTLKLAILCGGICLLIYYWVDFEKFQRECDGSHSFDAHLIRAKLVRTRFKKEGPERAEIVSLYRKLRQ